MDVLLSAISEKAVLRDDISSEDTLCIDNPTSTGDPSEKDASSATSGKQLMPSDHTKDSKRSHFEWAKQIKIPSIHRRALHKDHDRYGLSKPSSTQRIRLYSRAIDWFALFMVFIVASMIAILATGIWRAVRQKGEVVVEVGI